MAERTGEGGANLVKLSDSGLVLENPEHDVRGLDVHDKGGEQIGEVADLYVDEDRRGVRFLDVKAGGFLGIGEKDFLIPVEAVLEADDEKVVVDQTRQKVIDSPPLDTGVVAQADYQRDIYDHYGYGAKRPDATPGAWPGGV